MSLPDTERAAWQQQPLNPPPDVATVRRQRILMKLGTLWDSEPERSLSAIIAWYLPDFEYCAVPDETTEADLDALLASKGLSVSGGWKS